MDFHSLARKELQALCKKNKIPANITNVAMADALQALQHVEGLEEILNPSNSDLSKSTGKTVIRLPDIPRTACTTSTRRNSIKEESEISQTLTRSRRNTNGRIIKDINLEDNEANVPITPAGPNNRRRAPAASACRNIEKQLRESDENERIESQRRNDVPKTPAITSSRRRAPAATAHTKLETQNGDNSVQRVHSTRRSVRLLEQNTAKLSIMEIGTEEPAEVDLFVESTTNSERSEVSLEVEKNISGVNKQTSSGVDSEKVDDSEVSWDPKPIGSPQTQRESEVDAKDKDKSVDDLGVVEASDAVDEALDEGSDESDNISSENLEAVIDINVEAVDEKGKYSVDEYEVDALKSEQELGAAISDDLGVVEASDAVDEALDEGSDESDNISSENLEAVIDINVKAVDEKGPADVPITEQDRGSIDSLVVEVPIDVSTEAVNHVIASKSLQPEHNFDPNQENPQDDFQNLACKDSDMHVTEVDDIGSSDSEYITEGNFNGDISSDENSNDRKDNISDDDAITVECGPEPSVLPEDEMVGFKMSETTTEFLVAIKKSKEESDQLATEYNSAVGLDWDGDATIDNDFPSESFVAQQLEMQVSIEFAEKVSLNDEYIKASCPVLSPVSKMEVHEGDEEGIDNGSGKGELKKDKARQDENRVKKNLETMSLRKLRQMLIQQNKGNNKGESVTKEQSGKKRIALQTLQENCMAVEEESDKGEHEVVPLGH